MPPALENISCNFNQLTTLPNMPSSLKTLYCHDNQLTTLPAMPPALENISCNFNQLTTLPNMPSSLKTLYCHDNQLTLLPDLPLTLQLIDCQNNPQLEIKYPKLFNTTFPNMPQKIAYVNAINEKTRNTERTKQINKDDILLELYMKRMMHPDKIRRRLEEAGDDADIDAVNTAHVELL
jgi:Leucine-rich repeat (LRR) protein